MTTPAAERLVKYVLTMELDGAAQQNATKLPKIVEQAQAEATKIVGQNTKERLEFEKTAFDRITDLQKKQLGAAEATHRELAGIAEMMQSQITKAAEAETKKREEIEKTSLRRIQEDYEKHVATIQQKAREMNDGVTKAGEGVIKLGRGLATVGILQEETAEEMLRALIAVQAVVDLAKGGIEIYRGIQAAVDAYRASVVAATAAETALAAARGRTAGVTGLGGAAQLAGSTGAAGAAGAGSLAPVLGSLGAAIASLPGAIALAVAGVAGAGAMATNVGGIRDRTAQAMDPAVQPDGFWSSRFQEVEWAGTLGGSLDFSGPESGNNVSYRYLARQARESAERTQQMQAERGAGLEMTERYGRTAQLQAGFLQQQNQMRMQRELSAESLFGGPTVDSVHTRLGIAQQQMQQADRMRAEAEGMDAGPMRLQAIDMAAKMQIDAMNQVIDLKKQALAIEQETSREALEGAKKETEELKSQIAIKQAERDAAQNRLQSAQERFGQMDEATQRRAIAAMQKAQSGGELSREERGLLRSVGTEQAQEFASQGDIAAAEAAGFSQTFGARERAAAMAAESAINNLNLKLDDQRELVVRLQEDHDNTEKIVEAVKEQVLALIEQKDELMEQRLRRELERILADMNNARGGRSVISGS